MKGLNSFLLVFLGGGIGAVLRFLVTLVIKNPSNGFPSATFWVNVIGCFLIGILYNVLSFQNPNLKLILVVGFLGGFTTFSSFGHETVELFKNARYQTAFFYVLLSNICGLAAVYSGIKISSSFI